MLISSRCGPCASGRERREMCGRAAALSLGPTASAAPTAGDRRRRADLASGRSNALFGPRRRSSRFCSGLVQLWRRTPLRTAWVTTRNRRTAKSRRALSAAMSTLWLSTRRLMNSFSAPGRSIAVATVARPGRPSKGFHRRRSERTSPRSRSIRAIRR